MVSRVKESLRIKSTTLDGEVAGLIHAALADLQLAGVRRAVIPDGASTSGDPLIDHAVILFCKANFGYEEKPERFREVYERLKSALSLSEDYRRD